MTLDELRIRIRQICEDASPEDGDRNFSTFAFMPEGDVFRIVEKKQ